MPPTKVIKPKPVEATGRSLDKPKPVKVNAAGGELKVPAARKSRASSCPRRLQRGRWDATPAGAQGAAPQANCERRTRSSSTAPRPNENWAKTNPVHRKQACPDQTDPRGIRAETKCGSQSHKAFTVIPPDPKKRREIQRKAEAELAALEELRLSRAMAYVSINPSSVGGCMSLEEVRSKQQQEMVQARRKPKLMAKQVMEHTPVLTR